MAVAKTYENMEIMGEPFSYDNDPKKFYVRVKGKCPRCGGSGHYSYNQMDGTRCYGCNGSGIAIKEVRWYTDNQRAAMDRAAEKRAAAKQLKQEERRVKFAARNAFGFGEKGYITLIWGDNEEIKNWRDTLPAYSVLYNTLFGWYIPSKNDVGEIPNQFSTYHLDWNTIHNENDDEDLTMKDDTFVEELVNKIIYGESKSEYQGQPGDWLEHDVKIKKNISLSGQYGDSHMHVMEDSEGNIYVWTTASKSLEENSTIHLRMKVKEHKEYKTVKQTIVYYCKIK
jgi:hypothetical protein